MTGRAIVILLGAALVVGAAPSSARESMGIFDAWGTFRDAKVPRCYAIAKARPTTRRRDRQPFASVGTWPRRNVRGQVHFHLSRNVRSDAPIRLTVGMRNFNLTGSGANAWAQNRSMDAAIVAAMRSANRMTIRSQDTRYRRFFDSYDLQGAPTAMDAATLACAKRR
ncbi:MAG: hypothetical protein WA908_05850 [Pontixanthobacter sp.]